MKRLVSLARLSRAVRAVAVSALLATPLAAETPRDLPGTLQALPKPPPASNAGAAAWQKRWWIEKTARLLRGGEGLGPGDDVAALMRLPDEEVVRRFMADPRFGDTVLDFNMYFLGFKIDTLKIDGIYKRSAFDFANAVASAQALLTGGDYLKLFDLEGPFYMWPLPLEFDDPLPPHESHMAPETVRLKAIDEAEEQFARLVDMGAGKPPADDYCYEIEKFLEHASAMNTKLLRAFNDPEVFVLRRGHVVSRPVETITRVFQTECEAKQEGEGDVKVLAAAARQAFGEFYGAVAELLKFEPSSYRPRSVLEFKTFDLRVFGMDRWLAFGFEQSKALGNSSTNYNRKRAAYVLKRFLCDDLTPVGVDEPKQHTAGAHGSETTCYACHYKLDPMAGFFRTLGGDFYNYAGGPVVVFDDSANSDRRKYEANWAAAPGSGRRWNIGYVRSPRYDDKNAFGETLSDLSRILRTAPEAKRCLMKRLYQYAVADDQAVDGAWLDELTRQFEAEAAVDSAAAMKNAIRRVVLSNAFRQADADPRRCYDFGPGGQREGAPPCGVAHILKTHCAKCHGAGPEPSGGLDLTKWAAAPGGAVSSFPHFGRDRKPIAPAETLTRLIERLATTDPDLRMPKKAAMPSQERQALYLWAQEELARLTKAKP